MKTDYVGIDYSGPGSDVNRDSETGIRYGVIRQNSFSYFALDDVYSRGDDLGFEKQKANMQLAIATAISSAVEEHGGSVADPDELAAGIIDNVDWNEHGDESGPYRYESEGVTVQTTSHNDLWVFKSPFYTKAQFCSPCVPGAGNLDNFCEEGPKTYCLPLDWFENEMAPYSIWEVGTDKLVYELTTDTE